MMLIGSAATLRPTLFMTAIAFTPTSMAPLSAAAPWDSSLVISPQSPTSRRMSAFSSRIVKISATGDPGYPAMSPTWFSSAPLTMSSFPLNASIPDCWTNRLSDIRSRGYPYRQYLLHYISPTFYSIFDPSLRHCLNRNRSYDNVGPRLGRLGEVAVTSASLNSFVKL